MQNRWDLDQVEPRWPEKIRKISTGLIIGISLIIITLNFVKLPPNVSKWFVPFAVETPEYLPFDAEKSYATVMFRLGKRSTLKINYETPDETITVWATNNLGWNNVSSWDEEFLLSDGTPVYYHYSEHSEGMHMLSWQQNGVEYALDYFGDTVDSPKEELIKVAHSIIQNAKL